jgi:hypothetical protein
MRVRQFGGAQAPPHDKHWARPNYLFSRLLICGQCGHKFVIVNPGTMGWQYRGQSVCSNTINGSRAIVESVLLSAIQRDRFNEEGFMYFEQEVARLLAERYPRTGQRLFSVGVYPPVRGIDARQTS